jgi:D-alanine-D-alanine ligase
MGYGEEETAEFDSEITIARSATRWNRSGLRARAHRRHQAAGREAGGRRALGRVFNFCEGLKGVSREAQVPALLEAYDIPYVFSDPLTLALALDKAWPSASCAPMRRADARFRRDRKPGRRARRIDLCRFRCSSSRWPRARARASCEIESRQPRSFWQHVAGELLARFRQPVLVETFLPGREFTVGITGTGAARKRWA